MQLLTYALTHRATKHRDIWPPVFFGVIILVTYVAIIRRLRTSRTISYNNNVS